MRVSQQDARGLLPLVLLVVAGLAGYAVLWVVVFESIGQGKSSPTQVDPPAAAPRAREPGISRRVSALSPSTAAPGRAPTWPPARAFTARCEAPGGGCVPQCVALASGRCLDPCFIHTEDCSRDCVSTDGSCGWPPPDAE